jgi:hypothetical protein
MRGLVLLAAALLALGACDRKPEPAGKAAAPAAPVASAPSGLKPLEYAKLTPAAKVHLYLPQEVAKVPALYAKLYSEGVNDLDTFADGAKGEVEELAAAGAPARQLQRELKWRLGAETPRLLGLYLEEYENTGGAHPNAMLGSLIWDKQLGRPVKPMELMRDDANILKLDAMVCDAIHAEKKVRTGSPELQADQRCPTFSDVKLTLAPSAAPGRAGGIVVLFSPYEIGPWVEGDYRLTFPNALLAGDINPAYAADFAGAPPPPAK